MPYTDVAQKCFFARISLRSSFVYIFNRYMYHIHEVTNYIEPGRTAHKREKNKNNLVPSELRSSKLIKPRIIMKQELSI